MVIEIFAGLQAIVDVVFAFYIWKHRQDINTFIQKDLSFALNSLTNTVNSLSRPAPIVPATTVVPPTDAPPAPVAPVNG